MSPKKVLILNWKRRTSELSFALLHLGLPFLVLDIQWLGIILWRRPVTVGIGSMVHLSLEVDVALLVLVAG